MKKYVVLLLILLLSACGPADVSPSPGVSPLPGAPPLPDTSPLSGASPSPDAPPSTGVSPDASNGLPAEPAAEPMSAPVQIVSVSAGRGHTMALDDRGQVWAWGDNYYGQIGDGKISTYREIIYEHVNEDDEYAEIIDGRVRDIDNDVYTPKRIMGDAKAVYACGDSSFVITRDEKLYAWGRNDGGQLGDGSFENQASPVFIMDGVLDVDADRTRAVITKTDGTLYICGTLFGADWDEAAGRFKAHGTPVFLVDNVQKAVLEGATPGEGLLILTNDRRLINYKPVEQNSSDYVFEEIQGLGGVVDITAASQQAYALRESGDVYGWGANGDSGELGANDFWVYAPVFIADRIQKLCNGKMFIREDGTLLCWGTVRETEDYRDLSGLDVGGAVGEDLIVYGGTPAEVLADVLQADGMGTHFVALTRDGTVYTWGENFYGQLGDGSSVSRTKPEPIVFPGE